MFVCVFPTTVIAGLWSDLAKEQNRDLTVREDPRAPHSRDVLHRSRGRQPDCLALHRSRAHPEAGGPQRGASSDSIQIHRAPVPILAGGAARFEQRVAHQALLTRDVSVDGASVLRSFGHAVEEQAVLTSTVPPRDVGLV